MTRLLCSERAKEIVKKRNIQLIGFADLGKILNKKAMLYNCVVKTCLNTLFSIRTLVEKSEKHPLTLLPYYK
jgi:hypothetical protein